MILTLILYFLPETQNLSNCETRRNEKNLEVCLFGNIGNMFIDFTLFDLFRKGSSINHV